MARGIFLSLDGLDGTGKSTQCQLLADWLRGLGIAVTECRDPGGTAVGDVLRDVLLDRQQRLSVACETLLFMASRAQLVDEIIRPELAAGRWIISDRYLLATVVYQGHAGGLDPDQIWTIGQLATGGVVPDLTLVLDLPVAVARARRADHSDRMESRASEFHQKVRAGFLAEAKRRPERIEVIDADQPLDEIQHHLRRSVVTRLRREFDGLATDTRT